MLSSDFTNIEYLYVYLYKILNVEVFISVLKKSWNSWVTALHNMT